MSCLDNIISVTDRCGNETAVSLSGYRLSQAPEISPNSLADIANEKYISGVNLAQSILANSILDIRNDFVSVLASNNISVDLSQFIYTTSQFNISSTYPAAAGKERGLTLYKAPKSKNKLKRVYIKKVSVLPLADKENAEILIYDNGNVYTYEIDLTANMINTIEVDHLVNGDYARVLIDGTDLPVSSAILTCFTGCNGKLPNDCGYTKGFNGDGEISSKESFGISIDFSCECDYESILCDLAKSFVGKLVFLKTRIGLLYERIYGNRLNNLIVYGKDEAQALMSDLDSQYVTEWNSFVASLPNLLKRYNSDCLICRSISWKTNI